MRKKLILEISEEDKQNLKERKKNRIYSLSQEKLQELIEKS